MLTALARRPRESTHNSFAFAKGREPTSLEQALSPAVRFVSQTSRAYKNYQRKLVVFVCVTLGGIEPPFTP